MLQVKYILLLSLPQRASLFAFNDFVVDHEYVSAAPTYRLLDRLRLSCCCAALFFSLYYVLELYLLQSKKNISFDLSVGTNRCQSPYPPMFDTISKLLQLQLLNFGTESQLKSINNNITTHDFDFSLSRLPNCNTTTSAQYKNVDCCSKKKKK